MKNIPKTKIPKKDDKKVEFGINGISSKNELSDKKDKKNTEKTLFKQWMEYKGKQ